MTDFNWTADAIGEVKRLYGEGLSFAEIARQMGGGLTRNAVCGKLNRLIVRDGTMRQPKPVAKTQVRTYVRPPPIPLPSEPESEIVPVTIDGAPITLLTLGKVHCKWPAGAPKQPDFHYCGHIRAPGSPYCSRHRAIAYQPLKPQKETA